MQTFVYRDRGLTREFADRAADAGYDALMLTVDNQAIGNRERDTRSGFTNPPRWGAAEIASMAIKPGWLWQMRNHLSRLTFGNYRPPGATGNAVEMASRVAAMLDPAMNWADVEMIRRHWRGTFLIKGILHSDDAVAARERGVDGVIVSSHGGRQLDGAPATIDALPAVVDAVGDSMTVLLDGGVRRGSDVVKALALGARACLIGRPQLWGLAVAGEAGVAQILRIYRSEMMRVMTLLGVSKIADINSQVLFRRWTR